MKVFEAEPRLEEQWSKKNDVDPDTISRGSNLRVVWICREGHEWEATVKNRVRGSGCPYCSGRKVWEGFNDLATTHPELAQEWADSNSKKPQEVTSGSNYLATWRGRCGHSWTQPVGKRASRGDSCPYCAKAGTKILPGFNDLETHFPEIAKEWSPRNKKKASEVFSKTQDRYWWVGSCGHEWESPVANRTHNRSGCPFCAPNPKTLKGFNDLQTLDPEVASEWDYDKNPDTPDQVTRATGAPRWWKCKRGHSWRAGVGSRTGSQSGCPFCSGRRAETGVSDLETLRPEVVSEWAWERNTPLTPDSVTEMSSRVVWWICRKGHPWRAAIHDRTRRDGRSTGCPTCSASTFTSKGERELAEMIASTGVTTETTFRGLPGVKEVDVLCPDVKIAVEYNGLYWHSERMQGVDYHLRKTQAVNAEGYQLIHVWEDEWVFRRPVVEKMLKRKLGVSDAPRLNARSLTFREVTSAESSKFLDENHIQGASGGSWRGGLFAGEELVALMVMKRRSEGVYELVRFATSAIVRGGHSKLLKRAIRDLNPREVVTFSDNCVSGGELYAQAGFERVKELAPDYMYRVGQRREHKFNYRKARFKRDPNLKYEEGLTERELADLNGLDRVYDAGKVKWVLTCK